MKGPDPLPVPEGLPRNRRCDCGCQRPVAYHVPELDLAFSHRCTDHYDGALLYAHGGVLLRRAERIPAPV